MGQELLYTSAPFGLKPGSRGFCTVLSTQGLPAPLATALESLSGYRPAYPPSDARSHLNPVVMSHLKVQVAGRSWHVLSRIADYGLDYSQRPNKLAHHVVLDPGELVEAGPADLLNAPSFMRTEWHEEPRLVPAKTVRKLGSPRRAVCQAWKDLTGDAGWAGVIAESFQRDPKRPVFLIFEPGQDVLPLIAEALSLLPPQRRWEVTFSTYFTGLPQAVGCTWRCMLAGSTEAHQSLRFVKALRIDLTSASIGEATGGALVQAARGAVRPAGGSSRKPPALPVGHATHTAIDDTSDTDQDDGDSEYDLAGADNEAPPLPLGNVFHPHDKRRRRQGEKHNLDDAEGNGGGRRRRWIILGIALVGLLLTGSVIGVIVVQQRHRNSEIAGNQKRGQAKPNNESSQAKPKKSLKGESKTSVVSDSGKAGAGDKSSESAKKVIPAADSAIGAKTSSPNPAGKTEAVDKPKVASQDANPDRTQGSQKPPSKEPSNSVEKPKSSSGLVTLDTRVGSRTVLLSDQTKPIGRLTLWAPRELNLTSKTISTGTDKLQISEQGGALLAVISSEKGMTQGTDSTEAHQLLLTAKAGDKLKRLKWCELDAAEGSPEKVVFHKFPFAVATSQRLFLLTNAKDSRYAINWTLDAEAEEGHLPHFQVKNVVLQIGAKEYPFEMAQGKESSESSSEIELHNKDLSTKLNAVMPPTLNIGSVNEIRLKLTKTVKQVGNQTHGPVMVTLTLDGLSKIRPELKTYYDRATSQRGKWQHAVDEAGKYAKPANGKPIRFTPPKDKSEVAQLQARADFLEERRKHLQTLQLPPQQMLKVPMVISELDESQKELQGLLTAFQRLEEFEADMNKTTVSSLQLFYQVFDSNDNSRNVYMIQLPESAGSGK